ncbi:MAG TPA: DUF3000 domain-containing protein [Actinomycetales bacterium]|nr:DUF3000 domain-containing protein [Actinomycetales bacterium]
MAAHLVPDDVPEDFQRALDSLRAARVRAEVVIDEAPAPQRIAPYAVALTADVLAPLSGDADPDDDRDELATGRFVLLHDPSAPEPWGGTFRAVTFVRAELEPELGSDPLLADVGWSWLVDALAGREAPFSHEGGTVTRVLSQSFAALADRPASVEIELRASWTPHGPRDGSRSSGPDLGVHLLAWTDLLCTVAGLPPLPDGVTALRARRR